MLKQKTLAVVVCALAAAALIFAMFKVLQNNQASPLETNKQEEQKQNADVTADQARQKVQVLPEVREFQTTLAKAGKHAQIDVEDQEENWGVHVYEIVKEDGGSSHTATFGWYSVNKKTGKMENN